MNHERYQQFHQSIFWLYYAKAMLQAKLKHYNDAIGSFTACLDAKNYAQVLMDNKDLAKDELVNHAQVLKLLREILQLSLALVLIYQQRQR